MEGCTRLGSFLVMSLTCAPGRQEASLRGGSVQHFGSSVAFRRESHTAIDRNERRNSFSCNYFSFSSGCFLLSSVKEECLQKELE